MKVTDYILTFLAEHGVRHVFGITGGYITPLFDAFNGRDDIEYICTQHEQAAAMAADGYARFAGFGCAISTSGPGATNLLTGVGCSYFDSVPVLLISGQVPTGESRGSSKVRQRGFQETEVNDIFRPLVKYTSYVHQACNIPYELASAYWHATEGRPGPVHLDIPMDVLMADLPEDRLLFCPPPNRRISNTNKVLQVLEWLGNSRRPVIIYGAGARSAKTDLLRFIEMSGVPCLPSWAALDVISHDHPQFVSQFGVYGNRAGNYAVQNADLIIAIGTRLDGRMTGKRFAPKARKVVVDVDIYEAAKLTPELEIISDAGDFLDEITAEMEECCYHQSDLHVWYQRIKTWKQKYTIEAPAINEHEIHPLDFLQHLNKYLPEDAIIAADSGANLSWVQQVIHLNGRQQLFSAYGYSPMGYALPAAMGAHYATGKPVIAINGDGSMQMNIQELQTIHHYKIPVKVFILNNRCYGIIQQFQDELFDGRYAATGEDGGYSSPVFTAVAEAYGVDSECIFNPQVVDNILSRVFADSKPEVIDVEIYEAARIFPKVCFGNGLDNQTPLLPEDEVKTNMAD